MKGFLRYLEACCSLNSAVKRLWSLEAACVISYPNLIYILMWVEFVLKALKDILGERGLKVMSLAENLPIPSRKIKSKSLLQS